MIVSRMRVHPQMLGERERTRWPWTVPCVGALLGAGLSFTTPVTFLVGENGSGKSTLVEGLAEAFGLDSYGGRAGERYAGPRGKGPLGDLLRLEYGERGAAMAAGSHRRRKGFFLRAETAMQMMEAKYDRPDYWGDVQTDRMSHGEGFLLVFEAMFREPGLYVMDEPEAALSFSSCLQLVGLIHRLGQGGGQVVCATHSPLLAAVPGARILEVGEHGVRETEWRDLAVVDHWRRYLERPEAYLRHIVDP